jgi:predicted ATPase
MAREDLNIVIPATLQDALEARLDRSPAVREVAQVGAAIGREFPYDLVSAVVSLPIADLNNTLNDLTNSGLIFARGTPPDASYTFKHALVQDTAYDSMVRSKRHDTHKRITNSLIELRPDIEQTTPELLAHHYTEAGLTEPAIDYWQKAGEHALRRSANFEAINHLNKGLELLSTLLETRKRDEQELRLQLTFGPALMAVKGQAAPDVRQAFDRARVLGQQLGDMPAQFRALYGLYRSHLALAELDSAQDFSEQCLNVADTSEDVAFSVVARFALGSTLMLKGDFVGSRVHLERAIPQYDIEKHRSLGIVYGQDPGSTSLIYLSFALWHSGFAEQAIETGREAVALAKSSNHPITLAMVHMQFAMVYTYCRDWNAVRSQSEIAMELADPQEWHQVLTLSSTMHGRTLVEAGDIEPGILQIERGIAARKAINVRMARLFELTLLAESFGAANRIDEGLNVIAEALEFADQTGEGLYLPEVHRLKGTLLLQHGSTKGLADAEQCFHRAIEVSRRQQAIALELRAKVSLAGLWHKQGRSDEARILVTAIYGRFTEGFEMPDLQAAKALLDELS